VLLNKEEVRTILHSALNLFLCIQI